MKTTPPTNAFEAVETITLEASLEALRQSANAALKLITVESTQAPTSAAHADLSRLQTVVSEMLIALPH
jgi:hypothetical protein